MKTAWVLAGASTTALLIVIGYWTGGRSHSPSSPTAETPLPLPSETASSLIIVETSQPIAPVQPLTQNEQNNAIDQGELIDSLFNAGSSGSPEELTQVFRALRHADPEVREAAASVLLQYADKEALPHLRAAQTKATTDEEKAWLKEAIEFISTH